ncbi:MAG: hypothetical protein KTR29_21825 [Rhodothermaceae bacterium]|nr:hypothetical protein [Rhodothermaceae bacterium]
MNNPSKSNPIKSNLKTADIIAGTIAVLLAIPNLNVHDGWSMEKIVLLALIVVGIATGWYVAQNRYWMLKIFFYSGIMMLYMLLARLAFHFFGILAY